MRKACVFPARLYRRVPDRDPTPGGRRHVDRSPERSLQGCFESRRRRGSTRRVAVRTGARGARDGWPWAKAQLDRPVIVIVAKDEVTVRQLVPEEWEKKDAIHYASYTRGAEDGYYFFVRSARDDTNTTENENPYRSTYWAYGDLALSSSLNWRLPLWLERGLAAVLSNTIIGKKDMQTGRPVASYIQTTMKEGRFPLARVLSITRDSPESMNIVDRQRLDAQCWGLAQYVLYGTPGPEGAKRANTLVSMLLAGTPSEAAVTEAFGSVAALEQAYWQHIAQGRFFFTTVKLDGSQSEAGYVLRTLKPEEAVAVRAAWHASSERPVEARAGIAEIRKLNPDSPLSYEIEGRLLLREHAAAEASKAFRRAVDLGSENFYPYFRRRPFTRDGRRAGARDGRRNAETARAVDRAQPDLLGQLQLFGAWPCAVGPGRRSRGSRTASRCPEAGRCREPCLARANFESHSPTRRGDEGS